MTAVGGRSTSSARGHGRGAPAGASTLPFHWLPPLHPTCHQPRQGGCPFVAPEGGLRGQWEGPGSAMGQRCPAGGRNPAPTRSCRPGPTARWAWAPAGNRRTRPRPRPWPELTPPSSTSSSRPGTDRRTSAGRRPPAPPLSRAHPRKPPRTEPNAGQNRRVRCTISAPATPRGVHHPAVRGAVRDTAWPSLGTQQQPCHPACAAGKRSWPILRTQGASRSRGRCSGFVSPPSVPHLGRGQQSSGLSPAAETTLNHLAQALQREAATAHGHM